MSPKCIRVMRLETKSLMHHVYYEFPSYITVIEGKKTRTIVYPFGKIEIQFLTQSKRANEDVLVVLAKLIPILRELEEE